LPAGKAKAIAAAAEEIAGGLHDKHFVVDVFQTGSGTSTNMNANEVIARLARTDPRVHPAVHPNDDVNRGQSSNDVVPAAIHISAALLISEQLLPAMKTLQETFEAKAFTFHDVFKIGRTHLQDAVPMRLGQEFGGYARQIELARERIVTALNGLYELPIGGTAVGTGLNAHPEFGAHVAGELALRTGLPFREAVNHFEAQASKDAVCFLSGALRAYAVALTKIANDIRWLGSGPRCGIGELQIPDTQPGSSIMPGKVNPVIAESVLMACGQVIGHDATIAWCCAAGNFELNVMMPVMAYDLLDSVALLAASSLNFESKCIRGLEANRERAAGFLEQSLAMCTALVPELGYDKAAAIANQAFSSGRTVREVASETNEISPEKLTLLLSPARQAGG